MKQDNLKCEFFTACGGCSYLDLDDDEYYQNKIDKLNSILQNLEINITQNNLFKVGEKSRRKINLQVDDKNRVGFFAKASKDIVEIDQCYVANPNISKLISPIKDFLVTFENTLVKQVTITEYDNSLDLIFDVKRELNFAQITKLTELAKALQVNVSYRLDNKIVQVIILKNNQISYPNFKIELDGEIFIQATKIGANKIQDIIIEFIKNKFDKKINIVDIYSGFGSYSFAVADYAKEITAYEGSEKMVELIKKNALKNSLNSKINSIARDLISYPVNFIEFKNIDLAIINPPRNGAGPQTDQIAKSALKNLIYVSCNPESFVRDARILLKNNFKIAKITAIDQFYSTPHLELVATFER